MPPAPVHQCQLAKEPSLSAQDSENHQHWKWDLEQPQLVITVMVIMKEHNDQKQTATFGGRRFLS